MRNLLVSLAYSKLFAIEDFFIWNLEQLASDPFILKPFMLWIMFYLIHDQELRYKTKSLHEFFVPDVEGPKSAPSKDTLKGIAGSSHQAPTLEAQTQIPPFCMRMSSVGARSA